MPWRRWRDAASCCKNWSWASAVGLLALPRLPPTLGATAAGGGIGDSFGLNMLPVMLPIALNRRPFWSVSLSSIWLHHGDPGGGTWLGIALAVSPRPIAPGPAPPSRAVRVPCVPPSDGIALAAPSAPLALIPSIGAASAP